MASSRLGARGQCLHLLKTRGFLLLKLLAVVLAVLLFCEFLIYYLVIFQCSWPELKTPEGAGALGAPKAPEPVLRAMFLADTHLLGAVRGHWLDKLRREWQMERAFQTALWLLQPEVVFILGDVFDEGKWSSPEAWADDVGRFWKVFRHPPHVQLWAVAGNHDIGFHYQMDTYRIKRFEKVFSPERVFSWKGINIVCSCRQQCNRTGMSSLWGAASGSQSTGARRQRQCPWLDLLPLCSFVMINSVALEGDGCDICSRAEAELLEISHWLNCSREEHRPHGCGDRQRLPASAPILLQHFPLYRRNDANCSGEDAAPPDEKYTLFKERYDVLSQEVSRKLLWWLQPRLVLSGHTHSACEVQHGAGILEVSVPSFSWRNRNNPSFIMGSITPMDYALAKCYLPREDMVLTTYCVAAGSLMLITLIPTGLVSAPFHFGRRVLRKFKTM